jgi:hypothetical protein
LNPEYQKMAFVENRSPDAEEFDLRNGEEEEMGYEDLLSTIGDLLSPVPEGCACRQATHRLDPDFSGKQLQGPQFRPEETEEEKEKEDQNLLNNSATK